jgi:hypothetical protein
VLGRTIVRMMLGREATAPADAIIWGSTALLAILTGTGAAFILWRALHGSPATTMATGAVVALAVGFGLVGVSLTRPVGRAFLVIMAAALVVAFFAAAPAFTALAS